MISAVNVVAHMQLCWCSRKNYNSNIVQLEEIVVCYKVFLGLLIPITEKMGFFSRNQKYQLDVSQCISGNLMPLIAHVAIIEFGRHSQVWHSVPLIVSGDEMKSGKL